MSYASPRDLDVKWGEEAVSLAAFDPASQLRSEARIDAALCAASALMDGYFCKRYALPIDAAPSGLVLLRDICCDLAMGESVAAAGHAQRYRQGGRRRPAQVPRNGGARPRRHSAKPAARRAGLGAAVAQRVRRRG